MTKGFEQQIKFSVRVMVVNGQGKVLLGLKKKGFNANKWIFPGGRVDFGETVDQCGKREVLEETTLSVDIQGIIDIASETQGQKHCIFINLLANGEGQPVVTEPHEVIKWQWFNSQELPEHATCSVRNAIGKIKDGRKVLPL